VRALSGVVTELREGGRHVLWPFAGCLTEHRRRSRAGCGHPFRPADRQGRDPAERTPIPRGARGHVPRVGP